MLRKSFHLMSLFIAVILFFGTIYSALNVFAANSGKGAENSTAHAVLGRNVSTANIDRVFMGTSEQITIAEKGGREAWQITPSSVASAYLYVDLSEKLGNSKQDGSVYDIEIDYYDQESGYFVVWYDSADNGVQIAGDIYINATNSWKTARFTLDNAGFANGIDKKADLKISTRETGTKLPNSQCSVCISEIRVIRHSGVNPIYVESYTDEPGNTFEWFKKEKIVHNRLTNVSGNVASAEVTYRLVDEDNFTRQVTQKSVELAANEEIVQDINIDIDYCSKYRWYVDVSVRIDDITVQSSFAEDEIAIAKTDPDGIKGQFARTSHHFDRYPNNRVDECIELIKRANIAGVRASFNWSGVESGSKKNFKVQGTRAWEIIEKCADADLEILYQFAFGNKLYTDSPMAIPETDEEIEAWADYVRYMTEQMKDICDMYEVWNEPDLLNFNARSASPEALAKISRVAADIVHEVDPNAKVSGLSVTGLWLEDRLNKWMKGALEAGMFEKVDVLTLHGYAQSELPEEAGRFEQVMKFKEMAKEYGIENLPVWITETGNTTADAYTSELNKSNWITRAAILYKATGAADISYQYNFEQKGIIDNDREDNFGMVSTPYEQYNIEGKVGIPTKTYLSYAGMNYVLGGDIESLGVYDAEDNIKISKFRSKKFGKNVIALWTTGNNEQITLKLDVDSVDYYDNYGNKTTLNGVNGIYTFLTDQRVSYIVGDFEEYTVVDNKNVYELAALESEVAANDDITVGIAGENAEKYNIELELPDGARILNEEKLSNVQNIRLNVGQNSDIETYIKIKISSGENILSVMSVPLKIFRPADVGISFVPASGTNYNRWNGILRIENHSVNNTVRGYLVFKYPDKLVKAGKINIGCVPREKTAEITFAVPEIARKGMYNVEYELFIDEIDEGFFGSESVDFTMATFSENTPIIDGVAEDGEWPANTAMFAEDGGFFKKTTINQPFLWNGPEDLSAKVQLMWDEEQLYLYSEVTDNVHYQTNEPQNAWNGDQLQFALYMGDGNEFVAYGQGGTDFHEFGLAMLPDGSGGATYRYKAENNDIEPGLCESAVTAVRRNEENKKTYYEWSMPWADITGKDDFVPKAGQRIGFSILWNDNDNDGNGRKGWLEYASGIGASKNRDLFTYLYLVR